MIRNARPADLKIRFDHLHALMSGERFLRGRCLGGELALYICAFPPEEAAEWEKLRGNLVRRLKADGVNAVDVNLYDVCIAILEERGIWDRLLEAERGMPRTEFLELLQGVLDPAEHVVPAVLDRIRAVPHDVILLSGVGEVFPFLRAHAVLSCLQGVMNDEPIGGSPVVLLFPGSYLQTAESGSALRLFGRMKDDTYYRAFDIFQCEPQEDRHVFEGLLREAR